MEKKTSIYDISYLFNLCSEGCFEKTSEGKVLNEFGMKIIKITLIISQNKEEVLENYLLPDDPRYRDLSPEVKKQMNKQENQKEHLLRSLEQESHDFFQRDDSKKVATIVIESCLWLLHSWSNQAKDNMGNILSTIRPFLQQFTTPEIRKILCPEKSSISFDKLINQGSIIVPHFSSTEVGDKLSSAIITLLKSRWQHAVLHNSQSKRPKILLMDEAQKIITFGDGSSGGDFEYMEISRSFGGISILLTQSLSALKAKATNHAQFEKIHGVIRSVFVMGTNDELTINYMVKVAGKEIKKRVTKTVSEMASSPTLDFISERYTGDQDSLSVSYSESENLEDKLSPELITSTPFSLATGLIFNGHETQIMRCAFRPYYWKDKRKKWLYLQKNNFGHKQ